MQQLGIQHKIHCLTATKNRLPLLKKSIRCFLAQTYENKELIIVSDGNAAYNAAIRNFVEFLDVNNIRLVFLENREFRLGQIRNILLEQICSNAIFCQWDDDDLSHPNRLSDQYNYMVRQGTRGCFLSDQLHFFMEERLLYWVDWSISSKCEIGKIIPGTIMAFKDQNLRYPEKGHYSVAGEDSVYLQELMKTVAVSRLKEHGHNYVYVYHGRNTFNKHHHQRAKNFLISGDVINSNLEILNDKLKWFGLRMPFQLIGQNCSYHYNEVSIQNI